jgi:sentrin-specific protease 1
VAHPGVQGILKCCPNDITKKSLKKQNVEGISHNALLAEYARLNPEEGKEFLLRVENSRSTRLKIFGFQRNVESVIVLRRMLGSLKALPTREVGWVDPIKEQEHVTGRVDSLLGHVDKLMNDITTDINKKRKRLEEVTAAREAVAKGNVGRVDETCPLIRVLGPQSKKPRVDDPSTATGHPPRTAPGCSADLYENCAQGSGLGCGSLGNCVSTGESDWGETRQVVYRDTPSVSHDMPPLEKPSSIGVLHAKEKASQKKTGQAHQETVPADKETDPFADASEDEGDLILQVSEEDGLRLLDTSQTEDSPPSPMPTEPAPIAPSITREPLVVMGNDWTYDRRDLRTGNLELPALTEEMHLSNIHHLRMHETSRIVSQFRITITNHDLMKLTGPGANPAIKSGYLNDQIIDFYLELIAQRSKSGKYMWQNKPSVSVLPSLFYPRYVRGGYREIRRLTQHLSIFDSRLVFIPINLLKHWMVMVIDQEKKLLHLHDSNQAGSPKGVPFTVLTHVIRFLQEESHDKRGRGFTEMDGYSKMETVPTPQQANAFDCGAFICQVAEFTSGCKPLSFTQEDMPFLKQRMMWEVAHGQLLS